MPVGYKRERGFKKGHKINIGRKHSEETKRKMSLANIGKHQTKKTKIKISLPRIRKNKGINKGDKNCNWKGGTSEYPNSYEMKKMRLEKLNQFPICQVCYKKKSKQIHHIDKSKNNHNLDNLLAVCVKCHLRKFHSGVTHYSKNRKRFGLNLKEISLQIKVSQAYISKYLNNKNIYSGKTKIVLDKFFKDSA